MFFHGIALAQLLSHNPIVGHCLVCLGLEFNYGVSLSHAVVFPYRNPPKLLHDKNNKPIDKFKH